VAAVLALALVAGACSSTDSDGGSSSVTSAADAADGALTSEVGAEASTAPVAAGEVDRMVWAIQSPPLSMDSALASDIPTRRVQTAAFEGLLVLANDGTVQPGVASSFENPDPLTWVFTIRDDVTFWDGTLLTIDDVRFSWSRHVGPDSTSGVAYNFANVAGIEATDAATLTVRLTAPEPGLAVKAALWVQIMQKAYAEAAGDALGGPDKPGMGTGPFSITSYSSADGALLDRYDGYWGGAAKVRQIEFKVIGDPDTARLAIDSGEIDGYFDVPLIATRQWDDLGSTTMTYVTGAYNDMLTMDVTSAPFDDPNARLALAHLIDRDGLLGPLFNGRATTAFTVVPATQVTSTLGEDGAAALYANLPALPGFSIDDAKAALAKSATPDGFEVDLPVDTSQPWMSPLAQSLAQNAAEVGITINVKAVAPADWIAGLTSGDGGPLQLLALGAGTTWPAEVPPLITGSTAPFNVAKYLSAEIDATIGEVVAATTIDELMPPLTTLLTSIGDDLPYLPLFDEQTAVAISNDFAWDGGYSYWAIGQPWPLRLGAAG
jgi:peptide/nickel transport system substrate-binding protein